MIYLDNNATTPLDPEVLEAMMPFFTSEFGNPASQFYRLSVSASKAVDSAKEEIAQGLGASADELVFTSGATESVNLALKGASEAYRGKGRHIITVATEHRAVLDTCRFLESRGIEVTRLGVQSNGLINLEELREAIRPQTFLVSVMWANNETGVIQPVREISELCYGEGILCFCDASQAAGKVPIDLESFPISLLAFSSHKFYGPKGVGGLYFRGKNPAIHLEAQIHGGGHQGGLRSGTLNVPGIVGMANAFSKGLNMMHEDSQRLQSLRDNLENKLTVRHADIFINGRENRMPHVTNLCIRGVDSRDLIRDCSETVAFSSGSACTAADPEPSHVLQAMGLDVNAARSSIRISLGRFNTDEDIENAIHILSGTIEELRAGNGSMI